MKKTIGLTFAAAAVLLATSIAIDFYGQHVVASQRAAMRDLQELAIYCDHCETGLESWDRASALVGFLAFSVSIAGWMLWHKEAQPQAGRSSILGLDDVAPRRIFSVAAPPKSVVSDEVYGGASSAVPLEDESLTPLERVIRSY
jgi:hypothetical protein